MMRKPPRIIPWLLKRLIEPKLYNGIYGDLLEEYHSMQTSKWKANLLFFIKGISFLRFPILFKSLNERNTTMNTWKNYFKTSYRSLLRNKLNTSINILGLVVSFTACMAILQYVRFEKSYDNAIDKSLFRVTHSMTSSAVVTQNATTFFGAKDNYINDISGIASATHIMNAGPSLVRIDDQPIRQENIIYASHEFFDVFEFPILEGTFFGSEDLNTVAISKSTANKWFPNSNAIGKTVEFDGLFGSGWKAEVVMVFDDLPKNSHIVSEVILPMSKLLSIADEQRFFGNFTFEQVRWLWLSFHTYLELESGVDPAQIAKEANEIMATNRRDRNALLNQEHEIRLQPISSIHTTAGIESEMKPVNDVQVLDLFKMVAICILLIGWINYINLSTAKSVNRGKEVGVRKVLGSDLLQLKTQFQLEALLVNVIAFIASIMLLYGLAPSLERLTQVDFFDTMLQDTTWILQGVLLLLLGSFLSGFYPAQVLASFKPADILKGKFKHSGKGVVLRRILVGIQFAFTMFLMSGLIVVHSQMSFMLGHDLGIAIDQTILIDAAPEAAPTEAYTGKMTALRNELLQLPGVNNVSIGSMAPGILNGWRISTEDSRSERSGVFLQRAIVDHDYFDLYDIESVAGRLFEKEYGSESSSAILNVNATQRLGFTNPDDAIGYDLVFGGENFKVVGVVNDFYQRGVQFALEPMVFNLDTALVGNFIAVKMSNGQLAGALAQFEQLYNDVFPRAPFESRIVENIYEAQYENEQRFRTLFSLFTGIASVVAILGLLGLASFLLNQRLKEICVRKVLGAQSTGLFLILNKEYIFINLIAFTLAIPIAIYFMQEWLAGFENRIDLSPLYFILPLVATVLIVVISTLGQTMQVIHTNPAKILKEEN